MNSITPRAWLRAPLLAAFFMIAFQMAGKAIRDSLFLSHFPVTRLPVMFMASALVALGGALFLSILLRRFGPSRLVPLSFLASSLLLAIEWNFVDANPERIAVLFYLHFAGLGSALISLFWSLVNETYDPYRAKAEVARITSGAAGGGVVGGLLAERLGAMEVEGTGLLLLGLLHLACALATWRMPAFHLRRSSSAKLSWIQGFRAARATLVLRYAVLLVCLNALAAGLIDYVFKAHASENFSGAGLLRFFAVFYLAIGLMTWVVQGLAGHYLLQRVGLHGALSQLSWGILAGSLGSLLFPGLVLPALNRGWEMVVRSSFYRSSYELLFTPVSPQIKRSAKPVIDIGAERIGDAASGAIMQLLLGLLPVVALQGALWLALSAAVAGLLVVRKIARAYVTALQHSLQERAQELSLVHSDDPALKNALTGRGLQDLTSELSVADLASLTSGSFDSTRTLAGLPPVQAPASGPPDPIRMLRRELTSQDLGRVRNALRDPNCAVSELLPEMVQLLAWDEVARFVRPVLRKLAPAHTGQLLDCLMDPESASAIRGQIPRILDSHPTRLAAYGLLIGLKDSRFEVRFQCAKILQRMVRKLDWPVPREQILGAVLAEIQVEMDHWRSRLLSSHEMRGAIILEGLKHPPSDAALLQVFTLLSLIYPEDAMRLSFQALATPDNRLRGTAVEFLQSILPGEVLDALLPRLEISLTPAGRKSQSEALKDLMESREMIVDQLFDE